MTMPWQMSHRADPEARVMADRHYSRQRVGAPQFVAPGSCLVLRAPLALWVTLRQLPQYVRHAWAGAWVCSLFRNEGEGRSSTLIRQAIAASRAEFGDPPPDGMGTFCDATRVRHKRDVGRCFRRAGFRAVGQTRSGLVALQLPPDAFPAPAATLWAQARLFEDASGAAL